MYANGMIHISVTNLLINFYLTITCRIMKPVQIKPIRSIYMKVYSGIHLISNTFNYTKSPLWLSSAIRPNSPPLSLLFTNYELFLFAPASWSGQRFNSTCRGLWGICTASFFVFYAHLFFYLHYIYKSICVTRIVTH